MRLENVRSFASVVDREFGAAQINSLVLNAGLLFPNDDTRSADGFEAAFAVNHLAHYLLLRLLLPRFAQGATVIAPPLHADARFLAHPERDPNDPNPLIAVGRTYSSSKLCKALTARALAVHPDTTTRRLVIIAYDPGHTSGTGLVRNGNFPGSAPHAEWLEVYIRAEGSLLRGS
jgi:NAD(P)-dependent dehydrogenase (short-subunit alcohol dehydrogenase family)